MLSVSHSSQSLGVFPTLARYRKQLKRPAEVALPFLKLHPIMRRVCNASTDMLELFDYLTDLPGAVGNRPVVGAFEAIKCSAIKVTGPAIKVIGIVAAIFEYRAAKIAKDSIGLTKELKNFVCAIPSRDLEKINRLFWTVVISALSLGLTLGKSTELTLALEVVNVVVSLTNAVKEAKGEKRWIEIVAHMAMACVRVYRSSEPFIVLSDRHIQGFTFQEVFEEAGLHSNTTSSVANPVLVSMCPVTA